MYGKRTEFQLSTTFILSIGFSLNEVKNWKNRKKYRLTAEYVTGMSSAKHGKFPEVANYGNSAEDRFWFNVESAICFVESVNV